MRVQRALNYAVDRNHLIELARGGAGTAEVGCQMLPPNTEGYRRYCPCTIHPSSAGTYTGPDLEKAPPRCSVRDERAAGHVWFLDIPIGHRNGDYFVSVLRSLGYRAHLTTVQGLTWRPNWQAGVGSWGADFPAASSLLVPLFTCASYTGDPSTTVNWERVLQPPDRRPDRACRRARDRGPVGRVAALDADRHEITDLAPWVVIRTEVATDFVSRRTGNYTSCWLSYWNSSTAACLDQL